ncbi:hypothetical protein L3X38_011411 [Prunus dulcis]|uniref:Uncharacterized protein n=1 Tax=Prunus dulcis TaxID=3755 RepID=A0AAD4WHB8_PRUDU|nr:hypothetical protein L3X38_011411 [Prunus dulcis]
MTNLCHQLLHQDRYIPTSPYIPPIPFPGRLKKANQDKAFKEIYDILSKVNINLPLLDVVKQIPAYGKFIKHLMTHKLNFTPSEEVKLNKNALGLEGIKKTSIRLELAESFYQISKRKSLMMLWKRSLTQEEEDIFESEFQEVMAALRSVSTIPTIL